LIRELLPVGISGLVLAGLVSAVMSTADAGVVAIGSVVALDIYPSIVKRVNEKRAVLVGRVAATAVMVFGIVCAPLVAQFGQIYPLLLRVSGFMLLPVGTCFLVGRFVRRVNNAGALTTLGLGLITGPLYVAFTAHPALKPMAPEWLVQAHFYHVMPVLFLIYAAVLIGVSLLTAPPPPEKLAVLDMPAAVRLADGGAIPWWQGFKFWWWLFLGVIVALYVVL
jgi:SSS family solute:Na+ symporter